MSVVFDALRGHLLGQAAFSGITVSPYIARIEDGAAQSRGVSISVSDEGPFGERRFRGRASSLNQATVSVAINTKDYAETERLVAWFTDLDRNWRRPVKWRSQPASDGTVLDIAVLSFSVLGVAREETAERYFRATVNFEITYRR